MSERIEQSKALASDARMQILGWLKDPRLHFAHQKTGDPAEIGVCVTLIADKLGMSQPTVSRHLELLRRADFVAVNRIGRWSYFSRSERGLADYRGWLNDTL
ncbi:MAG TPA: ArsR family transcriptional regulator [Kiloniellaceae bacterium]|nr:ArsR family transcriptional regulator [Kiloniellaceae bacterium]